MKLKSQSHLTLVDSDVPEGVVHSSSAPSIPDVRIKKRKPAPKASRRPKSSTAVNEESGTPVPDEILVNELVAKAQDLYCCSQLKEKELLYQRVEVGRILIELKGKIDHGDFQPQFKKWQDEKRIHFTLRTGERAMAYAELERAGKFVDKDKNDIVSTMADAERVRKQEKAKEKEENAKAAAEKGKVEPEIGEKPLVKLKKSQIQRMAREYAKPVLEECDGCEPLTSRDLLAEIIKVLTEELEQITEELEK